MLSLLLVSNKTCEASNGLGAWRGGREARWHRVLPGDGRQFMFKLAK